MLEAFGTNIWIVNGPTVVAAAGFHYPTRMAIIRLNNGDLVLWSPTALNDPLRAEIEALGPVRALIAPNSLHHTFLGDWQSAYPDAKVYAAPGLPKKRKDIRFDHTFDDVPISAWRGEIEHAILWGNHITTEVILFHRQSGTAIFTDLIQQFPRGWFHGWRALVARLDLMTAPSPTVPRKFRLAFTDRARAKECLGPVLAWPTRKVIIAHGEPITENGQTFLKRAFGWLGHIPQEGRRHE